MKKPRLIITVLVVLLAIAAVRCGQNEFVNACRAGFAQTYAGTTSAREIGWGKCDATSRVAWYMWQGQNGICQLVVDGNPEALGLHDTPDFAITTMANIGVGEGATWVKGDGGNCFTLVVFNQTDPPKSRTEVQRMLELLRWGGLEIWAESIRL